MKWSIPGRRHPPGALAAIPLLLGACLLLPRATRAGSYVTTIQPDATQTDDSYLREDGVTEENGTKSELRAKASADPKNRNIIVKIPLTGLANKTILQAWLKLTESAANSPILMESRLFPLTESWNEGTVSWKNRSLVLFSSPWATPGGTHGSSWTDRQLLSDQDIGAEVGWQVGPILQAWNLGTLANNGVLIQPTHGSPDREVVFRSSETGTATQRPRLVIHYTDEAPAIRSGTAEIQPRVLRTGSVNSRLTLWLDVEAGDTPTGLATGLDQITLAHAGTLIATALESFQVDGATVANGVSFTDNGSSVTIKCPRVRTSSRIRVDLRVTVLSGATPNGVDLPVTVDDTASPGAWAQSLWAGDADGIAGNGDDWVIYITSTTPTKIHVLPDTARVVQRLCTSFSLTGEDSQGSTFGIEADSFRVVPALGTITRDGTFCAVSSGTAQVVAYWGSLRDTALVIVSPALTPQISSIQPRTKAGVATNALAPGDTMFLDVTASDGDGFQDIRSMDVELFYAGHQSTSSAPAYRAAFRWVRSPASTWTLLDPVGSSWRMVPSSCAVDTTANDTAPRTLRLAFVPGAVARASSAGEWTASVRLTSATPPDTTSASHSGIDALVRLQVTARDSAAAFSSGSQGASHLPLARPTDGHLELGVRSNAPWSLSGSATDLAGVLSSTDTMYVRAPNQRIAWALNPAGTAGGYLDIVDQALGSPRQAASDESGTEETVFLWVDHPATIPAQSYRGTLRLQVRAASGPSFVSSVPLTATVVSGGQAAQSALAEVVPHAAPAGTPAMAFDAYLLAQFQGTDTGIDHLLIDLPDGYGATAVSAVEVAGTPVSFADRSLPGMAEVTFGSRVTTAVPIHLRLLSDVPTALDSIGSGFVVLFDDSTTALPPQAAAEGNANGVSDGNSWMVTVVPGPLASLEVAPRSAVTYVGNAIAFAATGRDAFGHALAPVVAWSVEGGIGSVTSAGLFTATAVGSGRLIARSGTVADTALITVWKDRAIAVRAVRGPSTVYQGEPAATLTARVENLGGVPVVLDTLRLSFTRGEPGDADRDFTVSRSPGDPDTLPVGAARDFSFQVAVSGDALTGPLSVNARASGVETGPGIRLTDAGADTALVLSVQPGGFELTAQQTATAARPGQKLAPLLSLRLRNLDPEPHVLHRLTLTNRTFGPGDGETLDSELGDVTLFLDDGDGAIDPTKDVLLVTTTALEGFVHLTPLDLTLDPGAERRLLVASSVPLDVRDGDVLDVDVARLDDLDFERTLSARNAWPVDPTGGLTIDGMVADQIQTVPIGPSAIAPGAVNVPVFRFRVPPNGYQSDQLFRLAVRNLGTARPDSDVVRLRAWADPDGVFDAASDRLLGTLLFTGDRWQLSGLAEPVGLDGAWLTVTVDLSNLAAERRTLQLALPSGLDPGLGVASGNSGPLDKALGSPQAQTVGDVDRVTFTAMPVEGGQTRPGDRERPLLHLVATNSYLDDRTLTALAVTDITLGPGSIDQRDGECQLLTLRADGDGDGQLDDPTVDPVLATGFFEGGRVVWPGLAWSLRPFSPRHLWVIGDVSLSRASDGDVLAVQVSSASDLGFAEPTTVTAQWPLDSGARWTVDGLVAEQVGLGTVPPLTLGPGEGPAVALDLLLPSNGYRDDVLRGLFVTNRGTAVSSDLARVELWKDGGDGLFSGGDDDVSLGVMVPQNGGWQSPLLATGVAPPGARLFVAVTVSSTPTELATVRFEVPVNGIQFDSGNDGPIDAAIAHPDGLVLSSSPLLATLECPSASTLGQDVVLRMRIRNAGTERIDGISPSSVQITGPAALAPLSGPSPASVSLDPGAADTLTWHYQATAVGETRFVASASGIGSVTDLVRRAPSAASPLHRVFAAASRLDVDVVQTMPVMVNPGQAGVVPFSLTLTNPGGPGVSDVRLRGLHVQLETESGAGVVPSSLLARVSVHEGTNEYLVRTTLESSGKDLDLTLASPVRITGSEPVTLSLLFDLLSTTAVPTFRVIVPDSSFFSAEDATSLGPVTAEVEGGYPLRSNVARVVAPATDVDVTAAPVDTMRVGRGATAVPLLRASFLDRGTATVTSDARVASFRLQVRDSADVPVGAATRLRQLRVIEGGRVLATVSIPASSGPDVDVPFPAPLNLPADSPVQVSIEGDLTADAARGRFRVALVDSELVNAYDANTRSPVAVHLVPDPVAGGWRAVEAAAESLRVGGAGTMPASVVVGETGIRVLTLAMRHPQPVGTARVEVDSLTFDLRDEQHRPLLVSSYLERARLVGDGRDLAVRTSFSDPSTLTLPLSAFLLEPGDTARVDLVVDVSASAPAGTIEFTLPGSGFRAIDANTRQAVSVFAEPGAELPLLSGVGRVVTPSRQLTVGLVSRMPATLAADGAAVAAAEIDLSNRDPEGVGDIQLDHMRIRACDASFSPRPLGAVAERVELWRNGSPWAASGAISPDSTTALLSASQTLAVPQGPATRLELRWWPRRGAGGRVRLGLDRPDVGVIQPSSALLAVQVLAENGQSFPMWSEDGGLGVTDLAASYANFPNPFAAGRERTSFAYHLPVGGRVWLRILTPRGESVSTLVDGEWRAGGQHEGDGWDGRNGRGAIVLDGVYVAELVVRYDGGGSARCLRKVAVVR